MVQVLDFNKKEPTKVEKAFEIMQEQLNGIQRQIAGLCLKEKIKPQEFAEFNHKEQEILNFLVEAQKAEELIIQAKNNVPPRPETPTAAK